MINRDPVHGLAKNAYARNSLLTIFFGRARSSIIKNTALMILLFPMACSTTTTTTSNKLEVLSEHGLAAELGETSGLFCAQGQQYTIADSGNSPTLFIMDRDGAVIEGVDIPVKNHDWESITADKEYFYIGDFGNNAGKRQNLAIHKINRLNYNEEQQIEFSYDGYDPRKNELYAHDYDAEAMVAMDDKLVLFSKSWLTNRLKVYHVDKTKTEQLLTPVTEVTGLPGVITGADWDSVHQRFLVVGYDTNAFGITDPFIATLSEDYQLQNTYTLEGYGQVEGLCVMSQNEIWLTQENSPFSMAKLIKLKLKE